MINPLTCVSHWDVNKERMTAHTCTWCANKNRMLVGKSSLCSNIDFKTIRFRSESLAHWSKWNHRLISFFFSFSFCRWSDPEPTTTRTLYQPPGTLHCLRRDNNQRLCLDVEFIHLACWAMGKERKENTLRKMTTILRRQSLSHLLFSFWCRMTQRGEKAIVVDVEPPPFRNHWKKWNAYTFRIFFYVLIECWSISQMLKARKWKKHVVCQHQWLSLIVITLPFFLCRMTFQRCFHISASWFVSN